jgi:tetratricopeptide (TPR) repeat protein
MGSRWAFAVGAMTLCLQAVAASAEDKVAEAHARFGEGVKAYAVGDFERARLLFVQSLALVPRGSVLRNLGLAEMELGRPVDALHHLRAALELPDLDPKRRSVTENDIRDAYAATGHILVETRDGATLTIDREAVDGKAPFKGPIDVMPGKHALEASFAAKTAHADVQAPAGDLVLAKLPIEPAAPVPPPEPSASSTAAFVAPVATVAPVPAAPRLPELAPPPTRPFWSVRKELGAGIVAAGVVSSAAGVYFYAQATDAQNRANSARAGLSPSSCGGPTQPQACAAANDAWSTQATDATLNYVFLGVGVAAVVAGAAMFLWPESSASVAIGPVVSSRGGGLHLRGGF